MAVYRCVTARKDEQGNAGQPFLRIEQLCLRPADQALPTYTLAYLAGTYRFHYVGRSGANDIWATASGTTYHWNGSVWDAAAIASLSTRAIEGSGASGVWAVGSGGFIFHWE